MTSAILPVTLESLPKNSVSCARNSTAQLQRLLSPWVYLFFQCSQASKRNLATLFVIVDPRDLECLRLKPLPLSPQVHMI